MAPTLTLTTSTDDPLTLALLPPPDETPAQKALRLQNEALAKQRSDAIDAEIEKERKKWKSTMLGGSSGGGKGFGKGVSKGSSVKVLLLGQSESGKSTTLKNFQITYAPKAWSAEKLAWRAVILLNLLRAVNAVCDAIRREIELTRRFNVGRSSGIGEDGYSDDGDAGVDADADMDIDLDDVAGPLAATSLPRSPIFSSLRPSSSSQILASPFSPIFSSLRPSSSSQILASPFSPIFSSLRPSSSSQILASPFSPIHISLPTLTASAHTITHSHSDLITRLEPLKSIQRELEKRIGAGSGEDYGAFGPPGIGGGQSPTSHRRPQEFFVRSGGWKRLALAHAKGAYASIRPRMSTSSRRNSISRFDGEDSDKDWIEDVVREVVKRRESMKSLWNDRAVRECLKRKKVELGESAEFYLKDIDRIARPDYIPSDDDVVRARLRTVGVQEHRVVLETGPEAGSEWIIYDVGGSRSMRAQWPSYFDTVHAILFLAPVSTFDEHLLEDPTINRLDDTLQLWKLVCTNKLLQHTEIVLFLNKCDVLKRKLENGVRFGEWVTSYEKSRKDGERKESRENEAAAVGRYLRGKFSDIFRQHSPSGRGLHVHFTSVVDTKATGLTLTAVRDSILRSHLRNLSLI